MQLMIESMQARLASLVYLYSVQ